MLKYSIKSIPEENKIYLPKYPVLLNQPKNFKLLEFYDPIKTHYLMDNLIDIRLNIEKYPKVLFKVQVFMI